VWLLFSDNEIRNESMELQGEDNCFKLH
jgi:hypothetical protein